MIGILLVTHPDFGQALINTVELIFDKKIENLTAISIDIKEDVNKLRKLINNSIKKIMTDDGILILTDMFGGTPSNLSYAFLEEGKIEVISGVNLPILLRAIPDRDKMNIDKLRGSLVEYGRKSIVLASDILKKNKSNGRI